MPSNEVLEQRLDAAEARIKTLESLDRNDRNRESDRYAEILSRLARLETRVGFIAAGAGLISSILVVALKSLLGG